MQDKTTKKMYWVDANHNIISEKAPEKAPEKAAQ
jgi:hypothetical protein